MIEADEIATRKATLDRYLPELSKDRSCPPVIQLTVSRSIPVSSASRPYYTIRNESIDPLK